MSVLCIYKSFTKSRITVSNLSGCERVSREIWCRFCIRGVSVCMNCVSFVQVMVTCFCRIVIAIE